MRSIQLRISSPSVITTLPRRLQGDDLEEYLSSDGSFLLQLKKDSEIRFGPAFYKAAIYSGDGKLVLDFGPRRFFSYSTSGLESSKSMGPWNPTSPSVALVELLDPNPAPGKKIARLSVFDILRHAPLSAWDFESLVTHKMWSSNGLLYLFRDVYTVYTLRIGSSSLASVSNSKSPHCFLLGDDFVCVIEESGAVSVFDGDSGALLASDHLSCAGYAVRHAVVKESRNAVEVTLKSKADPHADKLSCVIAI